MHVNTFTSGTCFQVLDAGRRVPAFFSLSVGMKELIAQSMKGCLTLQCGLRNFVSQWMSTHDVWSQRFWNDK